MNIARSQLVKAGRGEDDWYLADAAFKIAGMSHGYLGVKNPFERLTGNLSTTTGFVRGSLLVGAYGSRKKTHW